MDLVRAADRIRSRLGEADVAHQSLLDEKLHGADRILDRNVGVDAVLTEQIDIFDTEALETRDAGLHHIFRASVDPRALPARLAEFRGNDRLVAAALDGAADQFFVLA